jgi:hypothetical protein
MKAPIWRLDGNAEFNASNPTAGDRDERASRRLTFSISASGSAPEIAAWHGILKPGKRM